MIVPTLLGVAFLAEATPVSSLIRGSSDPSVPWNPTMQRPGMGTGPAPLRSDIGTEHLYMRGQAPPVGQPPENGAAPGRFLVLTGVIAYTDPKKGFAIIGNSPRNTFLARPGQQLPDGSWIREIHPKNVVLEHEGNLETLGIYRHRDEFAGTGYAQFSPLPQQAQWGVDGIVSGAMRPSQARPIVGLPSPPEPSATRRSEAPASSEVLSSEVPPSDALPKDPAAKDPAAKDPAAKDAAAKDAVAKDTPAKQAQPDAPSPAAQDPADEFSDARRQRAENRGR